MPEDNVATECLQLYSSAKNTRSTWDSQFQQIVDYVRPNADDFTGRKSPGQDRSNQIYDSTAIDALEEFSSFLHSFLTNPTDRWFELRPLDSRYSHDREVNLWCEEVSNIIYHHYSSSSSGYTQALNEAYLDLGSFGTSVVYQYWKDGLRFKTFALADCYLKENSERMVDTVIRRVLMTGRQVAQEFDKIPPKLSELLQKGADKEFTIVHLVFPREDKQFLKHVRPVKNYASIWVCENTKETLRLGGYDWFPYHCPRWVKMSTEVWGRSPALKALPDIKMLNRLEYQLLKAVSKATDPPLIVSSEAFLVPLKTGPGAVNYKEPGSDPVETLEVSRGFQIPENKAEQKREAIRKYFYNDLMKLEKENVEMTAYEAQDRSERKLRLVAPMLGRQEAELLGPSLALSYMLLGRNGLLPPPPKNFGELKLEYTSPAARAQTGMRAFAMDRYIQRLIPSAQINPAVMDIVNWEAYSRELADAMGTTQKILFSPEEMQANNEAKAQQEQAAQVTQMAEPASKAIKNLSDAGISPQALGL
jgi:hypothetical protein